MLKRFYILVSGGYSVGRAYDARFLIDWRHPIDKKLVVGLFENELLIGMIDTLEEQKPDLFLDIGSHTGIYSVLAKRHCPDCVVHAFEPDPENLCQLHANLFLNKFHESVNVHDFGLSNVTGELYFDRSDNTGRGTRVVSENGNHVIKVKRLDDVLQHSGKKVYLKIDVEGHEGMVIAGADKFLKNNNCIIQIEIFPESKAEITKLLCDLGYKEKQVINKYDYLFTNV